MKSKIKKYSQKPFNNTFVDNGAPGSGGLITDEPELQSETE